MNLSSIEINKDIGAVLFVDLGYSFFNIHRFKISASRYIAYKLIKYNICYLQGFCDSRNKIQIVRPMRDITFEEIEYYISIKEIKVTKPKNGDTDNSLQSAITTFVADLQINSEPTISAICKVADKISGQAENVAAQQIKYCEMCQVI